MKKQCEKGWNVEAFKPRGIRPALFLLYFPLRCLSLRCEMRRSECYSGCLGEGKALTAEWELTGDRGSAFIVNLLCDFIEELLGGLCQQLCGSQRSRSGLRGGSSAFYFITTLHDTFALAFFFPSQGFKHK